MGRRLSLFVPAFLTLDGYAAYSRQCMVIRQTPK